MVFFEQNKGNMAIHNCKRFENLRFRNREREEAFRLKSTDFSEDFCLTNSRRCGMIITLMGNLCPFADRTAQNPQLADPRD